MAASALAAVVGAVLASELGVYGTILGAAVVSVGATVGSAVFQHLFKHTGEQLRNAVERDPERAEPILPGPAPANGISQDWNKPRVLRAKRRWTWKSYTAVSALVFVVAMVPITAVELAAGKPLNAITTGQSGGGTSFNPSKPSAPQPEAPGKSPSTAPSTTPSGSPAATPSGSPSPNSSPSPSGSATPSGSPSPSADAPSGAASAGAAVTPGAQDGLVSPGPSTTPVG
ncbi:hypothetical protein AB0K51_33115 [Kitasatospora sp. NPDC049285]|uniref:hypothetical protein n=1 Tax=Kitasatospora sp. NPDC049285 TaxID=3157096 RepID=UPI00343CE94F